MMMSLCSARKAFTSSRLRVTSVGGIRSRKSSTNTFSGALRTLRRIVDHQRLGMDALEQVRGGDVGHVERRVLAQQHHVEVGEVLGARVGQAVVRAGLVLDLQRRAARDQPAAEQREVGRRVVEELVAAPLRLEQQGEGGIAADVDAVDRVHLAGDVERHAVSVLRAASWRARRYGATAGSHFASCFAGEGVNAGSALRRRRPVQGIGQMHRQPTAARPAWRRGPLVLAEGRVAARPRTRPPGPCGRPGACVSGGLGLARASRDA